MENKKTATKNKEYLCPKKHTKIDIIIRQNFQISQESARTVSKKSKKSEEYAKKIYIPD